jgi:hypothetical protein
MKIISQLDENPFDEARRYLDEWQKAEPDARNIVLLLDGKDALEVQLAGAPMRASDVAGLCFAAAQLVVREDE